MQNEIKIVDLILSAAKRDERICAVLLVGSRVNPNAVKDIYQDYDVIFMVNEVAPFYNNPKLMEDWFGKPLIMQMPETMRDPIGDGRFSYLMLFEKNRIDLTFQPTKFLFDEEPAVVLLDKDGILPKLPPPTDKIWHIKPPTELFYYSACNNFWWCLNNVAKGIARDELPYVMDMMHGAVRSELNDMLNWYIGIKNSFEISVGKSGKYYKKYLPDIIYRQYCKTFSGSDYQDIWESIIIMCDLFHSIAIEVAERFNFTYRQNEEDGIRRYFEEIRRL